MNRSITFTEAGLQLVIDLLAQQPIARALPLFEDIRAQCAQQDADELAQQREAALAELRAEAAKEQVP